MNKFFQYLAFAIGIFTIVASGPDPDPKPDTPDASQNTPPSYTNTTSFTLSENNDFSQALTASDADGDALTFSLISEGDSQFFSVTGIGVLTSTSQFDFETPDDTNGDNVYEITLRITDNEAPILIPLKINVQNVGPVFSSPTNFTIDENEFFFSKITAESNDGSVATVTVSASDDSTLFDFEEATGELSTSETFDYETPQDSNQDNSYILSVTASDGDEITVTDISINVQDINGIDQTLLLPDDNVSIFSGETATRQINVQGLDGTDTVMYTISDAASWISINESGELTVDLANSTETPGIYAALIEVDDPNDAEPPVVEELTIEILDRITLLSGTLGPEGGQLENSWRDIIVKADPNQLSQEYEISYFGAINSSKEAIFKITTTPEMIAADEDKITLIEPPLDIISRNYFSPISSELSSKQSQKLTQKPLIPSEVARLVHPFERHKKSCLENWVDVNEDGHRFDYLWKATEGDFNIARRLLSGSYNGPPRIWSEPSWRLRFKTTTESQCASTLRSSLKWDNTAISTREPVLFVHGFIFGGDLGGFDSKYEYFGKFPGIVQNAEIDGREFAPYLFSWRTNANYSQVAEDLAAAIETLNARTGQKVHIVAHSYGGVLSRTLVQGLSEGFSSTAAEARIASLTTVGTPHSGVFGTLNRSVEVDGNTVSFPIGRQGTGTAIEGCLTITCHQTGEYWSVAEAESDFYGLDGDDKKVGALSNRLASGVGNYPDVPTLSLMGVSSALHRTACADNDDCSLTPKFLPSSIGDGLISLQGQRFKPDLRFNNIFENGDRIKERILDLEVVDVSDQFLPGTKYKTFREYGDGLLNELQQTRLGFNYKYEFANSYPWDVDSNLVKSSFGGIGHTASSASVDGFYFQNSITGSYNQVAVNSLTEVGLNICERNDVLNCNHPTWLYFRDHLRENIAGSYTHQTAEINASISVTQNGTTPNVPYTVIFLADGKEVEAESFPVGTSTASLSIPFNPEADYTAKVIPDNGTQTQVSAKLSQSKTFIPGFLRSIISVVLTTEGTVDESELVFPNVELVEALEEAPMGEIDFSVIDAVSNNPVSNFTVKVFNTLNKGELETLDVAGENATLNLPIGHYQVAVSKVGYNPNRPFTCSVLETQNNVCEISIEKNIDELLRTLSIERVSVSSTGNQSNENSESGDISADGRFVVFSSDASNLVNEDTNDARDIFIHDRNTKTTTRISTSADGAQGNRGSYRPRISADGRYVSFLSGATNLVEEVTTDTLKVYIYELRTGAVELVSVPNDGAQPNQQSFEADISSDGRYVAFSSQASNLVEGDTNNRNDVFLHDRSTSTTERISVSSNGAQFTRHSSNPNIYGYGRFIVYGVSTVSNMTDYYIYDSTFRTTERLPNAITAPRLSSDGRYVAFSSGASNLVDGDTNNLSDIFVYDRSLDIYKRISVSNDGTEVNGASFGALFSEDSGYIFFSSRASNLVENDTNDRRDVFVYDQNNSIIERIVVNGNNSQQGYDDAWVSSTSGNGRFVVIESSAANVVSNDTNDHRDIFVATLE